MLRSLCVSLLVLAICLVSALISNSASGEKSKQTKSGFIGVCGRQLCLNNQVWQMHSATLFKNFDDLDNIFKLTKSARLNSLRAVNFWNNNFSSTANPYE